MLPDPEVTAVLERFRPQRVELITRPEIGLSAFVVIDSTKLGPAAGGVRTRAYADLPSMAREACRLAQSMTIKCALAGLDAGGGKIVVLDDPGLKREQAFEVLGAFVESMKGNLRTAGDLGTRRADLEVMARHTRYVHTQTEALAGAVARGVVRCAEACADYRGRPGLAGLRAAVQGCGEIGSAVAGALHRAGAEVVVADIDTERAEELARSIHATILPPGEILLADVDVLCPCAVGDVITPDVARTLRAWALCPGANNVCSDSSCHQILHERGVASIPDVLSSAGAVIQGVGRTVMGLEDPGALIDALGDTARAILDDSRMSGRPPIEHAHERARARLRAAG